MYCSYCGNKIEKDSKGNKVRISKKSNEKIN